jgi:hypothetical protein
VDDLNGQDPAVGTAAEAAAAEDPNRTLARLSARLYYFPKYTRL